ncbi:MAG: cupin domain-containing protein [Nitrospiraceae bacterium]|nr:cupin domain-containing protein [Nitrospiraceae bacterium]
MNKVRIYRGADLPMRRNVPGAMMWAVGLEKSMLTYFEMESDAAFPEHSHEAEQITLVLEGELTFSYESKTVTLRPGEVIAIPSNVRHSVSTAGRACRAVDAWSPVRKEYLS